MPIFKKLIHRHEKGMGNEDWYYLITNTDTGEVHVEHEWSHKAGSGYQDGKADVPLKDFLEKKGTKQDKLLEILT